MRTALLLIGVGHLPVMIHIAPCGWLPCLAGSRHTIADIALGIVSGAIMFVLAITSYDSSRKWMNARGSLLSWKALHKLNYVCAIAAAAHIGWYQLKYPSLQITGAAATVLGTVVTGSAGRK
eukprot:SAG11_NODE_866_length_6832_cov_4.929303_4_plen_122_part_00